MSLVVVDKALVLPSAEESVPFEDVSRLILAATIPGRPIRKETTQMQPIMHKIVDGLERGRSGYLIAMYL